MRALVTGGANGIGEGISYFLARAGTNITVTSRTNEPIERLKQKLSNYDIKVTGYIVDFLDESSVKNLFLKMKKDKFQCDILVNNAGHNLEITDPYCDISDWRKIGSHATRTPVEMDMIFVPNFLSELGKNLILRNKNEYICLMLKH